MIINSADFVQYNVDGCVCLCISVESRGQFTSTEVVLGGGC